jgi:Fur family transcriptional regulator, iron response regulator
MRSTDSPRPTPADLARQLEQAGIVPTGQRLHIAEVLFSNPRHLTARQICRLVNRQGPVACRATVYNTLNLFAQRGLVREIAVEAGRTFYDPDTRPHHHFYNVDTDELIDMPPDVLPLPARPPVPAGMRATDVSLVIKVRNADSLPRRGRRPASTNVAAGSDRIALYA